MARGHRGWKGHGARYGQHNGAAGRGPSGRTATGLVLPGARRQGFWGLARETQAQSPSATASHPSPGRGQPGARRAARREQRRRMDVGEWLVSGRTTRPLRTPGCRRGRGTGARVARSIVRQQRLMPAASSCARRASRPSSWSRSPSQPKPGVHCSSAGCVPRPVARNNGMCKDAGRTSGYRLLRGSQRQRGGRAAGSTPAEGQACDVDGLQTAAVGVRIAHQLEAAGVAVCLPTLARASSGRVDVVDVVARDGILRHGETWLGRLERIGPGDHSPPATCPCDLPLQAPPASSPCKVRRVRENGAFLLPLSESA